MLHPGLTAERWGRMTLAEQLANVGTEVARAARARTQGDETRVRLSLELVLELFEFTLDDDRWRTQRLEIGRARDVVCDFLAGENEYGSTRGVTRRVLPAVRLPRISRSMSGSSPIARRHGLLQALYSIQTPTRS